MANSLQEELLKAGLVTAEQLERSKRSGKGRKRGGGGKRRPPRGPRKTPEGGGSAPGAPEAAPAGAPGGAQSVEPKPAPRHVATEENRRRSEKLARDMGLGRSEKKAASREKLRRRELRELVEAKRLNEPEAELPFHFQRGRRVKRIYVTPAQREQLAAGALVIVGVEGSHHLVPAEIGAQAQAMVADTFVYRAGDDAESGAGTGPAADDDYAGYEVPDDLMW